MIPEGDFCARGKRKTTDEADVMTLKCKTCFSLTAITDRNHKQKIELKGLPCKNERWAENPR